MCGIAGIVRAAVGAPVEEDALRRMARALRHRGPDGYGLALDHGAGLVSTRLAIVDPDGGWQPMRGDRGSVLAYNGEVFNHPELRSELTAEGWKAATTCDTEVALALLERRGPAALRELDGQFAIAWWEPGPRRLTLARDGWGIHPLHVAELPGGGLAFASEAKALFASGEVSAAPDPAGLADAFALWGPQPPRSAFRGVRQLAPGELLVWEDGAVRSERWAADATALAGAGGESDPGEDLEALLRASVRRRLRADVPVGAYLSGGLDSSLICALAQQESGHPLHTFSVAFTDPRYDERAYQEQVAGALGTVHHVVDVGARDIADAFGEVVRHAETPLVRTAPVPLWLLARATREHGITVVATGEGADELFWGYDLLKEVALRELHATDPEQALALVDALYPYLEGSAPRGDAWRHVLLRPPAPGDALASHRTRAAAAGAIRGLLDPGLAAELDADAALDRVLEHLPAGFAAWGPLERAAHLDLVTLLPGYLLAAQGDRVALAHGVEARFPFLDERVAAHARGLPAARKLDGLRDKVALRELAHRLLPAVIAERPKLPYRAPDVAPFAGPGVPAWVAELLSEAALAEVGLFDSRRVATLVRRITEGRARGVREGMALVAVLSTQLWHHELVERPGPEPIETTEPRVRIDLTTGPLKEAA